MDELLQAQRRMARALGRARAGEDRELAQRVREGGEALGQLLGGLLKTSRLHAADNRAFDGPAAEVGRVLAALAAQVGTVNLVAVEDHAYLNEMRLRSEGRPGLRDLGAELHRHNVGGLGFRGPLDDRQVRGLVAAFAAAPGEPHPRAAVAARLAAAGVSGVDLHGIYRFRTGDLAAAGQAQPGEALQRALRLSREAWEVLASGWAFHPLPLRRAVAEILEVGPRSPALWSAWVEGVPRHEHAVSVALHALLLGEAAGLPRAALQDLGVAALVHDVGYASLPAAAEGAGAEEALARHPGEGARLLLRQRGFSGARLRRLRAVLDHHRAAEDPRGSPSAVGAVLRIAEDYATFLRVYGDRFTATEVLGGMARAAGSLYHPALVQLFVNALGLYPPGSLLELSDGSRARSASPVRSPESFAAPLARPCHPAGGAPAGELLDLSRGPAVRRPLPG